MVLQKYIGKYKETLLLFFLATALLSCSYRKIQKAVTLNEPIEWSHSWVVNSTQTNLPRVLVIGDSHVEAYYPIVAKELEGKAYLCKFTTSRSLGDPLLIDQLELMLKQFKFDIVSFNNGLHGKGYTAAQYGDFIPVVYKLFKKHNNPKLLWVNTTAWRNLADKNTLDVFTENIKKRNELVEQFVTKKDIPLIDLYSLSINHPEYYTNDGVHFNKEGISAEGKKVASGILELLQR